MAKRGRPRSSGLDKAAIGIGAALGHAMNRLEKWRVERDEIVADIRKVIAAGTKALADLGHDATQYVGSVRSKAAGRPAGRKPGRRGGFRMSRAARAKISAAQKARWAARRKKAGGSSAD